MSQINQLYYTELESPIGTLTLVSSLKGLCRMEFEAYSFAEEKLKKWAQKYGFSPVFHEDSQRHKEVLGQLEQYFAGQLQVFTCTLDLYGTSFQKKVWQALIDIPFGETRSYKDIAQAVDSPKAVRAVGGANNKNNIPIIIPCHRVIGANGALVGFGGGLPTKEFLLSLEQKNNNLLKLSN